VRKILWRNARFVILAPDERGYEARLIEGIECEHEGVPGKVSFAAWFDSLEDAKGFAEKTFSVKQKGDLL
jgi:hypothetical protein